MDVQQGRTPLEPTRRTPGRSRPAARPLRGLLTRPAGFGILLLLGWLAHLPQAQAQSGARDLKALRSQAEQFERQADWDKACDVYDAILKIDRTLPDIKARLVHCLRRYYQQCRQRDPSYRKDVLTLGYSQTLKIYDFVVNSLLEGSLDRREVSPTRLFRKGLEELRYALADPVFCAYNLPGASPGEVEAFRNYLRAAWGGKAARNAQQVVHLAREVAIEALTQLNLNATTVVMELTCGACYALDDYTMYLTPAQLRDLCDSLKGESVGVGLRLAGQDGKLVIAEVLPGSPAAEATPALHKDEIVAAIDHKPAAGLLPETAQSLLQGEAGTEVELEIHSPLGPRHLRLRRRPVFVPSVGPPTPVLVREFIGYVQITCFQETTPQELDRALQALGKLGMKALILDIRGNSGGHLEAAVETARRFLAAGVIVSTQTQDPRFNTVYRSRNPGALTLPLVVLIDGDTASAAEVLAGALKENKRAVLVGQTTFGKGCLQGLLRINVPPGGPCPGGLRITVARFYSPTGAPYSGRGVTPNIPVPRHLLPDSMDPTDHQLEEALWEAQRLTELARAN
jgi:carboxyl-terminal processing protease